MLKSEFSKRMIREMGLLLRLVNISKQLLVNIVCICITHSRKRPTYLIRYSPQNLISYRNCALPFRKQQTPNNNKPFLYLFQTYIDSFSLTEAEDSSYDSEYDVDDGHEQVSRTTSDTLEQEYCEYVSQVPTVQVNANTTI